MCFKYPGGSPIGRSTRGSVGRSTRGDPPPLRGVPAQCIFYVHLVTYGRRRRPDAGALAAEGAPKLLSFLMCRKNPVRSREGAKNALFGPQGRFFVFFGPDPDPFWSTTFRTARWKYPVGRSTRGSVGRSTRGGSPSWRSGEVTNTLIYMCVHV